MRIRLSCVFSYGVATISSLLKIIGLFAEYRLFYRALLQKRPLFLRSLLIVATPYPDAVYIYLMHAISHVKIKIYS